uniref:non-specific serine/threonine protein kinase n=1 Tax=Kalanchoe fedtschenkoi TaxID=63787 RepID=A0A7N0V9B1_KALFE
MVMGSGARRGVKIGDSLPVSPALLKEKVDGYKEILRRIKEAAVEDAKRPGFDAELWSHFERLPVRYATDLNSRRAEDVLRHQRLLSLAEDPANRPVVEVRLVQVRSDEQDAAADPDPPNSPNENTASNLLHKGIHPPPTFGSSPNLTALVLKETQSCEEGQDNEDLHLEDSCHANTWFSRPMHEIIYSTSEKPKLLHQLTCILNEMGLNIQEAVAFSTTDNYSLDVFVVNGWPYEETELLKTTLQKKGAHLEKQCQPIICRSPLTIENEEASEDTGEEHDHVKIPNDGLDVWEINIKKLKFETKIASGSFGRLYKGTYWNQDVAIKVLRQERIDANMQKEFAQEVFIMRKVRHKNIVHFIGASTKPPNLCIVTEFMNGGSVYDYLHKNKGAFKLPILLKVAIDISRGMEYLHNNDIIHRDLKTANLLMDEKEDVKVADFGVARVKAQSGVMTAETGTYRWMAPEVIEHKPYDHKADIFSFGVVLWELLTGKIPYEYMTPLQAAIGVVQKGLRPTIPKSTHPKLIELLHRCWLKDPSLRPDFTEIIEILERIAKEVQDGERKEKSSGGFLSSVLKRSSTTAK